MNIQQKRKILLYKDSIDKIISNGIQPNLIRLEKCSKILRSNQISDKHSTKEYLNSHHIIKQLRNNLNELEKCYKLLNEFTVDPEYDRKVNLIKNEVIQAITAFSKISGQLIEEKRFSIVDESKNIEHHQQQPIQTQQVEKEEKNVAKSKQTLRNVQALHQDLEDLHEMMGKFGQIVHEQQTPIDQIEQNIENTVENVHEGTRSLAIAASSSVVPIACAAVGATIFGPIGALISFKLSTGIVSAIGGSVASYSLASYVKKRNQHSAELELTSLSDETSTTTKKKSQTIDDNAEK
uniref:Syntaxin-7-like n=1 Tax=Dermatophagoides pteronyssinus TaxID=6956 RepID=A0A6P6Y8Q4_DERPT|nr:syntaxin-7-like [Dermatophagoides pteronyssinus]